MGRVLVIIGWIAFFIGLSFYLTDLLPFLVPAFVLGGICIVVIGLFLSYTKKKSR